MNPDDFKQAWQSQPRETRLMIDAEVLLEDVQRKQREFTATIFWRDVREVGVALLLVPVWFYLGFQFSLPWTWYLTVPVLLWIAGFMLADRMRHKRQSHEPGEPLRRGVESSLAQVEHQIWLLRNVFWWYLLPPSLSILAFFGQVSWKTRSLGWWQALALFAITSSFLAIVYAGVYWVNQYAVRADLEPKRRELETLLRSLDDEAPAAS